VCIDHIFFIYLSISGYLGCFCLLAVVINDAMSVCVCVCVCVCKYLFETMLSIILDTYPEVGLLGHMIVLLLIFSGTTILLEMFREV